jgi:thioredoxin-like negative regulator of GroEL
MVMSMSNVIDVDSHQWKHEVSNTERLIVALFWKKGCYFCNKLRPEFDELSLEYGDDPNIKFIKIEVSEKSENMRIAQAFGVMGTPTIKFLCRGRPVGETVGYRPKRMMKTAIDDAQETYNTCIGQSSPI